jgi:hypothetical protein
MTEPEDFLTRWSRRKRKDAEDAAAESVAAEASTEALSPDVAKEAAVAKRDGEGEPATEPLFDISKLPAVESITAETDIRPFLAKGVPAALTQAALRQLWIADPKIRNFIEIAENQWDFNNGVIPGFDSSLPENAQELVAQIFAKTKEVVERAGELEADEEVPSASAATSSVSREPRQPGIPEELGSETGDAAAGTNEEQGVKSANSESAAQHADSAEELPINPLPRRHGSALPT